MRTSIRLLLAGALAAGLVATLAGQGLPQNDLSAGLRAYYPFDSDSLDHSGNGYHLFPPDPVFVTDHAGAPAAAFQMNGGEGATALTVPGATIHGLESGTISVWMRVENPTSAALCNRSYYGEPEPFHCQYNIFAIQTACDDLFNAQLSSYAGPGRLLDTFRFVASGEPSRDSYAVANPDYDFSVWHMFTFAWGPTAKRAYLDGQLVLERTGSFVAPASGDLVIGRNGYSTACYPEWEQLRGAIDELRIYDRLLSAEEVGSLYSDDSAPPVVSVPTAVTGEASGPTGASVDFSASAVDLVDGAVDVTCTPASGTVFEIGTTTVMCSATDSHGNTGTATFTVTVRDTTPPVFDCESVDAVWHRSDVVVSCSASDAGIGLANPADGSFALATQVPDGNETPDGATGSRTVCDKGGLCTTVGPFSGLKVDKKAPSIAVSAPMAGSLLLHQMVAAGYSCADAGSGMASCVGTAANGSIVDTATPGAKTFTVTGKDQVGNEITQSVAYSVVYSNEALYDQNVAKKSGSTYPIKVALRDSSGSNVSSGDIVVTAVGISLISDTAWGPVDDAGNANPDGNFRFAGGSYIFNLSTKGLGTGIYRLYFRCGVDPTTHTVQFQVK